MSKRAAEDVLEEDLRDDSVHASGSQNHSGQPDQKRARVEASQESKGQSKRAKKRNKAKRGLDWDAYGSRYIALKVAYLGWKYQGVAWQKDTDNTVEGHLFAAMERTRLIRDKDSCEFSRCGRTDKGVCALGQVFGFRVRSSLTTGPGVIDAVKPPAKPRKNAGEEMDYAKVLNGVLPDDIRVLAWAPVPDSFDARFDCTHRMYKYFFVGAGLDLQAMRTAGESFVGTHDFRNFCKMDVNATLNYSRRVLSFSIEEVANGVYAARIVGYAFLWHQIRCMMAVLFMVGRGDEDPSIVSTLLDIEAVPTKPTYAMAADEPLCLYDCGYENLHFSYTEDVLSDLETLFHEQWERLLLRTTMNYAMRDFVLHHAMVASGSEQHSSSSSSSSSSGGDNVVQDEALEDVLFLSQVMPARTASWASLDELRRNGASKLRARKHVALLERPRESSMQQRMAKAGIDADAS